MFCSRRPRAARNSPCCTPARVAESSNAYCVVACHGVSESIRAGVERQAAEPHRSPLVSESALSSEDEHRIVASSEWTAGASGSIRALV
jgi:hypothetical protein